MLVRGRRIALCIKQKSKEMCHTGVLFWNPSYKTHASLFKAGLALYSEQAGRCLMGCRRHPVPMSKKNSIEALTSSYIAISFPSPGSIEKGERIPYFQKFTSWAEGARELGESAELVLHAHPGGGCLDETRATSPQRSSLRD